MSRAADNDDDRARVDHEAWLAQNTTCDCESYEPCNGECCGPGMCTCSRPELSG